MRDGRPKGQGEGVPDHPPDGELVRRIRAGDAGAMNVLMSRYDRLVRYTIFRACRQRCARDPHWLDARASETWTGFLQSIRRHGFATPDDLSKYLTQIARNKCRDAIRIGSALAGRVVSADEEELSQLSVEQEDTAATVSRLETLDILRACMQALEPEDRAVCAQLTLIVERRWKEAAEKLGIAESTLRSRWARILERLRSDLDEKNR